MRHPTRLLILAAALAGLPAAPAGANPPYRYPPRVRYVPPAYYPVRPAYPAGVYRYPQVVPAYSPYRYPYGWYGGYYPPAYAYPYGYYPYGSGFSFWYWAP